MPMKKFPLTSAGPGFGLGEEGIKAQRAEVELSSTIPFPALEP